MPGSAPLSLYVAVPPTAGGGLERSTWLLLRGFDRSLVRPTLVLTHTRTTNARLIDTLPADIEVIEPAKRGFLDQRRLVGALRRVYEDRRPDVVMGRATYANLLALLARRGARHRPAVIATEHATPDLARQPRNLWMLWLGRQVYRDAVAVVAVGAGLGRAVASSFRVQPDRLSVIPNAYDPDLDAIVSTADAASQRAAGDAPVIVFVGRLSHEKGVDDLIRALPRRRRSSWSRRCAAVPRSSRRTATGGRARSSLMATTACSFRFRIRRRSLLPFCACWRNRTFPPDRATRRVRRASTIPPNATSPATQTSLSVCASRYRPDSWRSGMKMDSAVSAGRLRPPPAPVPPVFVMVLVRVDNVLRVRERPPHAMRLSN